MTDFEKQKSAEGIQHKAGPVCKICKMFTPNKRRRRRTITLAIPRGALQFRCPVPNYLTSVDGEVHLKNGPNSQHSNRGQPDLSGVFSWY